MMEVGGVKSPISYPLVGRLSLVIVVIVGLVSRCFMMYQSRHIFEVKTKPFDLKFLAQHHPPLSYPIWGGT